MVAQLLSEQATDRLQDRLGDVAVSFKRQQEQEGRKDFEVRGTAFPPPPGGFSSVVAGSSNQVRRLPSPHGSGKVLVKHGTVI